MRGLFVVCILVLLLPILLWAQSSPGILSGTVLDSSRAVLATRSGTWGGAIALLIESPTLR
jgi:hypothetical protein